MFEIAFIAQILRTFMNNTWASVANSLLPIPHFLTHTYAHTLALTSYVHFTRRWPGPGHFLYGCRITEFASLLCSVAVTDLLIKGKKAKTQMANNVCHVSFCVYINPCGLLCLLQQNPYWWSHRFYCSVIVLAVCISTTLWQYNV